MYAELSNCSFPKTRATVKGRQPRKMKYNTPITTNAMIKPRIGDTIIGKTTLYKIPPPSHQCLPAEGALAHTIALKSPCAAAKAAPHKPPTSAWLELDGSPTYQVSRFQRIAPSMAQINMCDDDDNGTTRASIKPEA